MLNFYQINRDCEIRTRDRLVIKALIPCQRTISTQKLKLLGEVSRNDLYYSLTKGRLTAANVLTLFSGLEGFIIYSDALKKGLGCVLMQHGRVIAFALRKLKQHEVNYLVHDLDLAIIGLP